MVLKLNLEFACWYCS